MKLLSVFLIAGFLLFANCIKCPNLGKQCRNDGPCDKNAYERCYRDLDGTKNATKSYCCSISCPTTKLRTFHSVSKRVYSHKWNDKLDKDLFYKDQETSVACPYPYSQTTVTKQKDLPVNFSTTATAPLKTCTTNGDCGEGFYCGRSVNPSFDNDLKISTIDESDNGKAMQFCYPIPEIDKRFRIAIASPNVGLPLCNEDKECFKSGAICFQFDSLIDEDGKTVAGFCAQAFICDIVHPSASALALLTTKGELCSTSADCGGLKDDDKYIGECVSLFSSRPMIGQSTDTPTSTDRALALNGDRSMCCLRQRTCARGTAQSPMMLCKSNSDCNKGGWCDESEICCYDPSAKQLDIYCPGGLILAEKEPACNGHCKNGKCINGRCCPIYGMENNMPLLGIIPYITHTPCKPNEQLPAHALFIYCPPSGFYTVIGTHDIEGKPLMLEEKSTECKTNADCTDPTKPLCLRVSESVSRCIRDPLSKDSAYDDSWNYMTVIYLILVFAFVAILVVLILYRYHPPSTMWITRRINTCSPWLAGKLVNKDEALKKMKIAIANSARAIAAMFEPEEERFDGILPEFTVTIARLYLKLGVIRISIIYEVSEIVAQGHYIYSEQLIIKIERKVADMIQMDRIHRKPRMETYINKSVTIKLTDLRRGNTQRQMVILTRVKHDEDKDENRGLSEADRIETEPSTELSSKTESLKVDKTQSDRSKRKKAGNNLNEVTMEENWENLDNIYDNSFMAWSENEPPSGCTHPPLELPKFLRKNPSNKVEPRSNNLIYPGNRGLRPVVIVDNHENIAELRPTNANPHFIDTYSQFSVFIVNIDEDEAYTNSNMESAEEVDVAQEIEELYQMLDCFNDVYNTLQRLDAGADDEGDEEEGGEDGKKAKKIRHQKKIDKIVKSLDGGNIKKPTNAQKIEVLKEEIEKPLTGKDQIRLYEQLMTAYNVKIKEIKGKELEVLAEALEDINKALVRHKNNIRLLERLAHVCACICQYKPSEEKRVECVKVFDKLIELDPQWSYFHARGNFAYGHIIMPSHQRLVIFGETYDPEKQAVQDLLRAEEMKPNQLQNLLMLGKIELSRKDIKKAREYLKKAANCYPANAFETELKNQAIALLKSEKLSK